VAMRLHCGSFRWSLYLSTELLVWCGASGGEEVNENACPFQEGWLRLNGWVE
jgi:hypothetical protein